MPDLFSAETTAALLSPETSGNVLDSIADTLHKLPFNAESEFLWRLLALNPALPQKWVPEVAKFAPAQLLQNPSFALLCLTDPAAGEQTAKLAAAGRKAYASPSVEDRRTHDALSCLSQAAHGKVTGKVDWLILMIALPMAVKVRNPTILANVVAAVVEGIGTSWDKRKEARKVAADCMSEWPTDSLPLLYQVCGCNPPDPALATSRELPEAMKMQAMVLQATGVLPARAYEFGLCLPENHPSAHEHDDHHATFMVEQLTWDMCNQFQLSSHVLDPLLAAMDRYDAFAVAVAMFLARQCVLLPFWHRMNADLFNRIIDKLDVFRDKHLYQGYNELSYADVCKQMKHWEVVEEWLAPKRRRDERDERDERDDFNPVAIKRAILALPDDVLSMWLKAGESGKWPLESENNHHDALTQKTVEWMRVVASAKPKREKWVPGEVMHTDFICAQFAELCKRQPHLLRQLLPHLSFAFPPLPADPSPVPAMPHLPCTDSILDPDPYFARVAESEETA